jgi:hypothetical protein
VCSRQPMVRQVCNGRQCGLTSGRISLTDNCQNGVCQVQFLRNENEETLGEASVWTDRLACGENRATYYALTITDGVNNRTLLLSADVWQRKGNTAQDHEHFEPILPHRQRVLRRVARWHHTRR